VERFDLIYKYGAVGIGGAVGYLWGGWSQLLSILLTFVVIDYITGILAAGKEGKVSSSVGFRSIPKKIMIFLLVAVGHLIDQTIGDSHMFRDAVIFFFLSNELISILENAGRIGVPIPSILNKAVEVLKTKGDK
jgi:toxin secretion/phage lysis holin